MLTSTKLSVRDVVTVKLPAASAYLSVLRTATAGLAARLDFTLDEIEDLRIAVDEACAMLLAQALPGTDLTCEFELTGDAMRISVSVLTVDGEEPSRDTFAWTVLSSLAGEVDAEVGADDRVTVTLQSGAVRRGPRDGEDDDGGDDDGRRREHRAVGLRRARPGTRARAVRAPRRAAGGRPERQRIRDQLVELHLPLVEYLARRFRNRGGGWTT